jgi:thiopurine S-methyltransferase
MSNKKIKNDQDSPANSHERDNPAYWTQRYEKGATGWDIGSVSTPIKEYVDQLTDRSLRILIPGAGNAYEAEYLWRQGFSELTVLDIAQAPLDNLRKRVPDLPPASTVLGDFFTHQGTYDLILEQTFFCSFPPTDTNRQAYAKQMHSLLSARGKVAGLLFNFPLDPQNGPPFGGSAAEYRTYFSPFFNIREMSTAHNSIKPRTGKELFIIMEKQ